MALDNGLLLIMIRDPAVNVFKAVDEVFPSAMVYTDVEETCIGIESATIPRWFW